MTGIEMAIEGIDPVFDEVRYMAQTHAGRDNPGTMLVAWSDRKQNNHSPCCIKCRIDDESGREVYGRNYEGRLRISFNSDDYVFICTR